MWRFRVARPGAANGLAVRESTPLARAQGRTAPLDMRLHWTCDAHWMRHPCKRRAAQLDARPRGLPGTGPALLRTFSVVLPTFAVSTGRSCHSVLGLMHQSTPKSGIQMTK